MQEHIASVLATTAAAFAFTRLPPPKVKPRSGGETAAGGGRPPATVVRGSEGLHVGTATQGPPARWLQR